ncbi:Uncharacterised protein [Mycobacteroides abscessus subsp. massiliense]|nr:Uncharacterised protein [Mycobacteroides abscessus subsp. massiliense]
MPILAHLRDQHTRPATIGVGELLHELGRLRHAVDGAIPSHLVAVYAADGTDFGLMAPVDLLQRVGDLPDRRLVASGVDGQRHQVVAQSVFPGTAGISRGPGQFIKCTLHRVVITLGTQLLQFGQLFGAHP